ncbi:DUF1311 domain-containing protein [Candidatus Pantoea soli]|uniref:DUF1311 domain-containing protein n=2 Tax=Candidatus Pantoea soli TaxID=3098669 RepID=A0A518X9J7_9GAMM|nr:DUF1311 domain-containing protein [Pantoea soli]
MNLMKVFLFSISILAASLPSFAQGNCDSAVSDAEINACYSLDKTNAENKLNNEYSEAKKRINKEYSSSSSDMENYNKILIESQRGWLKYRDGQCELESYLAEKGTITHDTLYNRCIARIDEARTSQLKSMPYE